MVFGDVLRRLTVAKMFSSILELVLLLLVTQWPLFKFAGRVDWDEFQKSGAAAGSTATALLVYKTWKSYQKIKKEEKEESEEDEGNDDDIA